MKRNMNIKRTQKNRVQDSHPHLHPSQIQTSIISSSTMDVFDNRNSSTQPQSVKEVETMELAGIVFYLDKEGNVYNTYDVLNKKKNPRIIGKYVCQPDMEGVGIIEYL